VKKRALIFVVVIFAVDARAQTVAPLTIGQVIRRVRAAYAVGGFAADFTQTDTARSNGITRTTSGRVVLANGKSDWEYAAPSKLRIVSDTANVCTYDPTTHTLSMGPVGNSWLAQLLPFFTGPNTTSNLTLMKPFLGGYVIEARPATTPTAPTTLIYIDATTFEIRRVIVLDPPSNRYQLDFTRTQHNITPTPSQFTIHPPPNTTFQGPTNQTALPATCP
jgi:outer membrane lipoprotein-sorting protein